MAWSNGLINDLAGVMQSFPMCPLAGACAGLGDFSGGGEGTFFEMQKAVCFVLATFRHWSDLP